MSELSWMISDRTRCYLIAEVSPLTLHSRNFKSLIIILAHLLLNFHDFKLEIVAAFCELVFFKSLSNLQGSIFFPIFGVLYLIPLTIDSI
jgi:hypothetical protein